MRHLLYVIVLFSETAGYAKAQVEVEERDVKAAFLRNFARFVEWPAGTFKSPSDPIVICVIGEDSFASVQAAAQGKTVETHSLVVRQLAGVDRAAACHILFISASERKRVRSILDSLPDCGVLTVGEVPGFAGAGGVINFKNVEGRIRIEINPAAAERQHLHVSAKLMNLAEIVKK